MLPCRDSGLYGVRGHLARTMQWIGQAPIPDEISPLRPGDAGPPVEMTMAGLLRRERF